MEISKTRHFLAESIFWAHVLIVVPIVGMFFVPLKFLPARDVIHFVYIAWIVVVQISWGFFMMHFTGKYHNICPVTTVMQKVRGFSFGDERNWKHSFIAEFFDRYGAKGLNSRRVNYMMLVVAFFASVRFFF